MKESKDLIVEVNGTEKYETGVLERENQSLDGKRCKLF